MLKPAPTRAQPLSGEIEQAVADDKAAGFLSADVILQRAQQQKEAKKLAAILQRKAEVEALIVDEAAALEQERQQEQEQHDNDRARAKNIAAITTDAPKTPPEWPALGFSPAIKKITITKGDADSAGLEALYNDGKYLKSKDGYCWAADTDYKVKVLENE